MSESPLQDTDLSVGLLDVSNEVAISPPGQYNDNSSGLDSDDSLLDDPYRIRFELLVQKWNTLQRENETLSHQLRNAKKMIKRGMRERTVLQDKLKQFHSSTKGDKSNKQQQRHNQSTDNITTNNTTSTVRKSSVSTHQQNLHQSVSNINTKSNNVKSNKKVSKKSSNQVYGIQ